jgi:hypothetical protein
MQHESSRGFPWIALSAVYAIGTAPSARRDYLIRLGPSAVHHRALHLDSTEMKKAMPSLTGSTMLDIFSRRLEAT